MSATGRPSLRGLMSKRQAEIARLVAEDLSNKEIAHQLGMSDTTVKAHMTTIMARLGVRGRVGVAVFVHTGWLPTGAACPIGTKKRAGWDWDRE